MVTLFGMIISSSDAHPLKAPFSIEVNEKGSFTCFNELQFMNELSDMIVIDSLIFTCDMFESLNTLIALFGIDCKSSPITILFNLLFLTFDTSSKI